MDQDRQTPPAHLFKHRAVFFKGVPAMHFLPEADRPEVDFARVSPDDSDGIGTRRCAQNDFTTCR